MRARASRSSEGMMGRLLGLMGRIRLSNGKAGMADDLRWVNRSRLAEG